MVPAPTYQNLPTFGTGASLVQPIAGTYNGGFLPGQLFPAEYENWLMNYITANSNTSQTSVVNLVAEMGTILAAASITPSAGLTNQLYAALNALYLTLTGGTLTGGLTLGGVLNMASHKITNVTDPTNAQDAATQSYALGLVNGNNHGLVTLTSGTSWTVPAGVTRIMVTTIGGGGGGGGGGGNAGGPYPGDGAAGGSTTFTGAVTSAGGGGGGNGSANARGGAGGGGNIGQGGPGGLGPISVGGPGGGAGGRGSISSSVAGETGCSYGGGGGGGVNVNGPNFSGGGGGGGGGVNKSYLSVTPGASISYSIGAGGNGGAGPGSAYGSGGGAGAAGAIIIEY